MNGIKRRHEFNEKVITFKNIKIFQNTENNIFNEK